MKNLIERLLQKVFGQQAQDPDPDKMNAMERTDALHASERSGAYLRSELAEPTSGAAQYARESSQHGQMPQESAFVDSTDTVRELSESAHVHDGSHLRSEIEEGNLDAEQDAYQAGRHEPPRSEIIDDSDIAREAAARASEPAKKRSQSEGN